jgi:hypothetical protein
MTEQPTSDGPPPPQSTGADFGVRPTPAHPPVNAGWAVTALLFFWPLSFSAFTHAFNVYPLWASGDVAAAQYASDRVRRLGQLSLWLAGGLLLLFGIVYAIFIVVLISQGEFHHGGFEHGYSGEYQQ